MVFQEQEKPQATDEEFYLSQREETAADSVHIPDETRQHTGYFNQSSTAEYAYMISYLKG